MKAFSNEHLNAEYAGLCEKLTQKLGRKRPSSLVKGKRESWSCGIVRTIGWVTRGLRRLGSDSINMLLAG